MNFIASLRTRFSSKNQASPVNASKAPAAGDQSARFGTFTGVFIPNITMMFGVILFLRLGLITSYMGPVLMTIIIVVSAVLMLLTSASITSIVTNMRVGGGGVYYLISRSLGIELGGAVGIILYLSQVISIALCTSGFAYSVHEMSPSVSIAAVEVITLVGLALLSFFSSEWALKTQTLIFVLIVSAVASVFFTAEQPLRAYTSPLYFPQGLNFWTAFAMFFPAMTGIEAGMAMSGSLKNPSRSMALGNVISVVVAFSIYLTLALYIYNVVPTAILQRDPMILLQYVKWPAMIYLGIWAATLSSVLGGILGAPRMLQTIAEDKIVPAFLAKTHGAQKEPRMAILITFVLALIVTFGTSIDQIIPILAMVRLITYCILNLVAAFCELINSPNWRPSVRVPWYISALGAALCFFVMFMIDAGWTFAAMLLVASGYFILAKRKMEVAFRDIRSNILFYFSRLALYRLADANEKTHLWHPQLLAFTITPQHQEKMAYLCHQLTKHNGILTFASILPEQWSSQERIDTIKNAFKEYFKKRKFACLVEALDSSVSFGGMAAMIKTYGIGPIYPNTVVMGMPKPEAFNEGFYELLQTARECKKNMVLFLDQKEVPDDSYMKKQRGRPKTIDVWWDPNYRTCFELLLTYLKLLTDSSVWKGARVNLKAIVNSENSKESLLVYFREYLEDNRLPYQAVVHVHEAEAPYWQSIATYSSQANLLFIPLRPLTMLPTKDEYEAYYTDLTQSLKDQPPALLVSWYDEAEHKKMYKA